VQQIETHFNHPSASNCTELGTSTPSALPVCDEIELGCLLDRQVRGSRTMRANFRP
jgi:hypothetical protein